MSASSVKSCSPADSWTDSKGQKGTLCSKEILLMYLIGISTVSISEKNFLNFSKITHTEKNKYSTKHSRQLWGLQRSQNWAGFQSLR